ncbi:hypothetical protein [Burkholderia gladioli]|uniref:hypothetical protein n=1 Tax=Burkholderia gladioli TaxID=28095 RepID=UPI00163E1047|nr:hypothetical protein [Burkholderia gladioli]
MRALRSGRMFRAGRRHGKTGGGLRALAATWSAAATVAAAALELRNARIAPWLGVPRGAAVATVRGRRSARRRRGRTGGSVRALAVARAGAATVAAADVEPRNACIAPWLGVPRGAAVATVRGRRPARRRLGETGSGLRALVVTKSAVETVASAQPESCLTLRGRIPLHCAARGRGKME